MSVLPSYQFIGERSAPVLVLSHSMGANREFWDPQVEALSEKFHLLLYDHRGHGASESPPQPWTMDDFGEDLVRLLDTLDLDTVHFCGLSLGGMVGIWFAQNAPDRLDQLIIANTTAYTKDPSILQNRLKQIQQQGMEAIVENILKGWFTSEFLKKNPETAERIRRHLQGIESANYTATGEAVCEMDLRAGLSKITSPTLVITGSEDQPTPKAWGEEIAAEIQNAQVLELPAAHMSNIEAPAAFNQAILDFLD